MPTPNGEYPPELLERLAETLNGTSNSVISGMDDIGVEVPVEDVAVVVKALREEGTDKCQKCGRWVSVESRRNVWHSWNSHAEETCRVCDPRPEGDDEEEPDEDDEEAEEDE